MYKPDGQLDLKDLSDGQENLPNEKKKPKMTVSNMFEGGLLTIVNEDKELVSYVVIFSPILSLPFLCLNSGSFLGTLSSSSETR